MKRNPEYLDDASLDRNQFKARSLYRRSQQQLHAIHDALMCTPIKSRKQLHERLDKRLDDIARIEATARSLDPDLVNHLTMATDLIRLD